MFSVLTVRCQERISKRSLKSIMIFVKAVESVQMNVPRIAAASHGQSHTRRPCGFGYAGREWRRVASGVRGGCRDEMVCGNRPRQRYREVRVARWVSDPGGSSQISPPFRYPRAIPGRAGEEFQPKAGVGLAAEDALHLRRAVCSDGIRQHRGVLRLIGATAEQNARSPVVENGIGRDAVALPRKDVHPCAIVELDGVGRAGRDAADRRRTGTLQANAVSAVA